MMKTNDFLGLNNEISLENWTNWSTTAWFIDLEYQQFFPKEFTNHPGQTTFEVYYRLMLIFTNPFDNVLDPFSGTGTGAIVARLIDRNFLGIELNNAYYDMSVKNLSNYEAKTTSKQKITLSDSRNYQYDSEYYDYIVTSPPYFNKIRYSKKTNDLSQFSDLSDYIQKIGDSLKYIGRSLKKGKNMSIIIGDAQKSNQLIPIHCLLINYLKKDNWKLSHLWINFISESTKRKKANRTIGYPNKMFPEFNHEYILNFEKN